MRLGFRQIKGLSEDRMKQFVDRRGSGYETVRDVWLRSGLDVDEIEKLAQADAFRSIGLDRRAALWAVRALDGKSAAEKLPLFDQKHIRLRELEPETRLPTMPLGEHVIHDYRSLGLRLRRIRWPSCASGWTAPASRRMRASRPSGMAGGCPSPALSWCASAPARATPFS
ncbi:hypothetical protein AJ88_00705 [Mesorhizobium amorphae CCBAU 01583]|nr:hypothetical protein AJ88_00705 [Mesorhizobium amorphae CCBAU 01583]